MAEPTSVSDIIFKMSDGKMQTLHFHVSATLVAWRIGGFFEAWPDGGNAGGDTPPTTAAACSKATGGLAFTNPGGGNLLYVVQAHFFDSNGSATDRYGWACVHDRLLHISGLSGTVTTAQTVGGTLTRNTGGEGNRILVTLVNEVGVTPTTFTCSYTNQAGTAGRTTQPARIGGVVNSEDNSQFMVMPTTLQSGDTGVRSVESVTLAGSTGTAGDIGVSIIRPIVSSAFSMGTIGVASGTLGLKPMPYIDIDACLGVYYSQLSVTEGPLNVVLVVVES